MAVFGDIVNYCNGGFFTGATGSAGVTGTYYGVTAWTGPRGWSPGSLVRQSAVPALNAERIFVALTGGTGKTGSEPPWTTTRGATTAELNGSTILWMEATGLAALNGDLTNTPTWAQLKTAGTPTVGMLVQRNNGASLQICQAAGGISAGEPSFSDTAGVRTVDGSAVWISLGAPGNYTKWGAPHARLTNALANNWAPAGYVPGTGTTGIQTVTNTANNGICYVGKIHNEGQAQAMTITSVIGTGANALSVQKILCVDHSVAPPTTLASSAVVGTTGAALTLNFADGGLYTYGITFSGGSAISNTVRGYSVWDACVFAASQTSGAATFALNTTNASTMVWNNTQAYFGHTGTYIDTGTTTLIWQNTAAALAPGSVTPRALLGHSTLAHLNNVIIEGVDLSGLTGPAVINNQPVQEQYGNWLVKDCKLASAQGSGTGYTGPAQFGQIIQYINSDSTATAYKSTRVWYEGVESTETTIVRTGGAVDLNGQAQSRKIVTTTTPQWTRPFKAEPMTIWSAKTGQNVIVTIYGTWNTATVPNNDDIWIEVEYLGSAGAPLGSFANSTKASILAAFSPLSADGSTWGGGGSGAGWSPFSMSVTLSAPQPQLAGLIQVRPRVAKFTSTFYIDPKIVLT